MTGSTCYNKPQCSCCSEKLEHRPTDTFNIQRQEKHSAFKENCPPRSGTSTSMSLTVYSRVPLPSIHKNPHFLSYNASTATQIPTLMIRSPGLLALPHGLSLGLSYKLGFPSSLPDTAPAPAMRADHPTSQRKSSGSLMST